MNGQIYYDRDELPRIKGFIILHSKDGKLGFEISFDDIYGSEQEARDHAGDFWPEDDLRICSFDAPCVLVAEIAGTVTTAAEKDEDGMLFT